MGLSLLVMPIKDLLDDNGVTVWLAYFGFAFNSFLFSHSPCSRKQRDSAGHYVRGHAISRCRPPHVERKEIFIPELASALSALRNFTDCFNDSRRHRPRQERRHRIPDLAKTVPLRHMKAEPVRIRMQARGFTHSNAPRRVRMNGPRGCERSPITRGACPNRIADPVRVQLVKAAHGFGIAMFRFREPFL